MGEVSARLKVSSAQYYIKQQMNGVNSINLDGITVTSNIFYDQYFFDSYTVVSCSAK